MNGATAFGWMLVKEEDYRELMKERQEARDLADTHEKYIPILQADYNLRGDKLAEAEADARRYLANQAALSDRCKALEEQLAKSQSDLAALTAKQKQTDDDLKEARKLLWGVPDFLPRDAAEQVDWARMGLPDPLDVPK
jgi:chromosome segregation ATPase